MEISVPVYPISNQYTMGKLTKGLCSKGLNKLSCHKEQNEDIKNITQNFYKIKLTQQTVKNLHVY